MSFHEISINCGSITKGIVENIPLELELLKKEVENVNVSTAKISFDMTKCWNIVLVRESAALRRQCGLNVNLDDDAASKKFGKRVLWMYIFQFPLHYVRIVKRPTITTVARQESVVSVSTGAHK